MPQPPTHQQNHPLTPSPQWDPLLINALVQIGLQLITYDYAGIGHSTGTVKPTIAGFASDVSLFLSALLPTLPNNTTSVDILGFSIGGYVAQQLTLTSPSLVRKLILAGTGPSGSLGHHQRPMPEVQSAIMAPSPDPESTTDAFFPSFFPAAIRNVTGDAWLPRILSSRTGVAGQNGEPPSQFFTTGPALTPLIKAYLSWDADPTPYSLLQTIQNDVLVTCGDNDLIVPTANSVELARQIPRAKLMMYPAAGHGHLFQYAGFYAKQVGEFVRGEMPDAPFFAGGVGGV